MDQSARDLEGRRPGASGRRAEYIWASLVLAVAAWLYFWTATSAANPFSSKLQPDDLYNRLSDGFLAGQLSFVEHPNPKLADLDDPWDPKQNAGLGAFHDVTYYHEKYYLYFGPAPAVLLLAPWKAITGTYLGENVAAALFAWLGVVASAALVLLLRRRHFPGLGGWVGGLCLVGVAFANFALPMLRRPIAYELAIASAYAFAMTALLCVALALLAGPRRRIWLFLAGLSYGLTLACRPNYLFGAVVLLAPLVPAWVAWRRDRVVDRPSLIRDLLAIGVPFGAIAVLLAAYNAMRFGSPFEFGTYYMLSGLHPQREALVSFRFLPANLWFYLLAPAQLSAFFPFFDVIHLPWFTLPAGYNGEEDMYGILPNMPFLWMAFLVIPLWLSRRVREAAALRALVAAMLAMATLDALVILRLNGASNRYLLDLLPPLIPLACLGVFWLEEASATVVERLGSRVLWIGALALTALFNGFVSLQHNDLLRIFNPTSYRRLAHSFNHVSVWLGETSPSKVGPLHLRLKFPADRMGQLEPLLVTGLSFKADFIYLLYTDPGHIQIGFEHTSYGGAVTKPPIKIDYGAEHTLDIDMGSLYPPVDHPYFDGIAAARIAALKKTLRVVLDGQEVLTGTYDFYDSSPGDVNVGRNPVSDAFGLRFTGQIIGFERKPVAAAP